MLNNENSLSSQVIFPTPDEVTLETYLETDVDPRDVCSHIFKGTNLEELPGINFNTAKATLEYLLMSRVRSDVGLVRLVEQDSIHTVAYRAISYIIGRADRVSVNVELTGAVPLNPSLVTDRNMYDGHRFDDLLKPNEAISGAALRYLPNRRTSNDALMPGGNEKKEVLPAEYNRKPMIILGVMKEVSRRGKDILIPSGFIHLVEGKWPRKPKYKEDNSSVGSIFQGLNDSFGNAPIPT